MFRIIQLTTVHPRGDTRIALRECSELNAIYGSEVALVVSDGKGDDRQGKIRVLDTGKPAGGRIGRAILGGALAFRTVLKHKPECLHFHDPELIPVGLLCKLMGMRVVYDVHEWVPTQMLRKHWLPHWLRRPMSFVMRKLEQQAGRWFDRIVVATPAIKRGFPRNKTVVIQNFPIKEELETIDGIPYENRPPEFAYIGGITQIRSMVEIVQALGRLGVRRNIKLHMAGSFRPAEFRTKLETTAGWEHVVFYGWVGRAKIREILGCTRAGIILCYPHPGLRDAQPVKLFEYMSAGLPVIASDFPLWRELIEGSGAGLLVDPLDSGAISDAMEWLLDNPELAKEMGANGKQAVENTFNWKWEAEKLNAMYRELIGPG